MGDFTWVPASNGHIPPNTVTAGRDTDGTTLFAGHAIYAGDYLPAKISATKGGAFVAYNSAEYKVCDYEVLTCASVAWTACRDGEVPPNAIEMGSTKDGEKLYMGRVLHEGTLTPGKIHPSHKVLYIPFDGKEYSYACYDVLVLN